MFEITNVNLALLVPILALLFIIKFYFDNRREKEADNRVREAEKEVFKDLPEKQSNRLSELSQSQEGLEERTEEISKLVEESRDTLIMGGLFNLYSKQIQKYQQQTRTRATWSFIFAILAMTAGLGFVVWGGTVLLTANETIVLAAGGIIATVGGAVSSYITKTFLDIHRLSLNQLNRYFRQPVINDHILMAQRLADESGDPETKKRAYQSVIDSIAELIRNESGFPKKEKES